MAMNSDIETLTAEVLESFSMTTDQRLKQILGSLVTHLHDFVQDVAPSIEEWEQAIDFLARTGMACTDVRQEFILLSDVLGVSMLVETINGQETPEATDSTVLGPFHMVDSPSRSLGDDVSPESEGPRCIVSGRIVSADGTPVGNAVIDVWQANANGFYDVQQPGVQSIGNGRALLRSDPEGHFNFRTVIPMYYPIPTDGPVGELLHATHRHPYRPAHIHFLVSAPGYRELTTHIFIAGGEYLESDSVFAVKDSLIKDFSENPNPEDAERFGVQSPFRQARFTIVLHPES